jgi:hypothetical protein
MDLKAYFKKLRQVEADLPGETVVIASLATPDGGKADALAEAPRTLAAQMIVDGRARLASAGEAAAYGERAAELRRAAERKETANRIQVVLVSEAGEEIKRQKPRPAGPKD